MNEFHDNLWAPWRTEYVQGLGDGSSCFLCDYRERPDSDAANHVVWRVDRVLLVMNRFPYTNGHVLLAPMDHKADLDDLTDDELERLFRHTRDAKRLLQAALSPHGFNLGINFGRCAGAGLPGHLHVHVVPRWNGDTNFMAVLGDVRVIPQALDRLHGQLVQLAGEMGLPSRDGK